MNVTLKSPAKLNLFLDILGKNSKNYHDLYALFCRLDLYDFLEIQKIPVCELKIRCQTDIDLPLDFLTQNILQKSYHWYKEKVNKEINYGVSINLEKNIPLGGGLGGGSSNAAMLLNYLAQNDGISFSQEQIREVAYQIGADVPFFLFPRSGYLGGIGEKKISEVSFPNVPVVVINPGINIATAQIFAHLKKSLEQEDAQNIKTDFRSPAELIEFLRTRKNDLEEVALTLFPELFNFAKKLRELMGGNLCRMTGSGSSYFCLFEHEDQRDKYAREITVAFPEAFIHSGFCLDGV